MTRFHLNLNGIWHFALDPENIGLTQKWFLQENQCFLEEKSYVYVPSCWNHQNNPECSQYNGVAWYWTTFQIPIYCDMKQTILFFEGISHHATTYVDGEECAVFHGDFIPFSVDISKYNDQSPHFLAVRIDGSNTAKRPAIIPKTNDYVGIFGDVEIQSEEFLVIDQQYLETVLHYDKNNTVKYAELTFNLFLRNNSNSDFSGFIRIQLSQNYVSIVDITREVGILKQNSRLSKIILHLDNPDLWSPHHPAVYNLSIHVGSSTEDIIEFQDIIGIRDIDIQNGEIWLNGKPLELHSTVFAIDDPQFGYNIPYTVLIDRLIALKKQNINILRPNQGIFSPFLIEMASWLGFLLIQTFPLVTLTLTEKQRYYTRFIIQNTYKPALAFYSVHPEIDVNNPIYAKNLLELERLCTNHLDPGRIFLSPSLNTRFIN